MKKNQEKSSQRIDNIGMLRHQLRKKLIEIGMKIDSKPHQMSRPKKTKKSEEDVLPVLHSFRNNKQIINEYKQLFDSSREQILKQRQQQKKWSKQFIRGSRYNYSVNSSREHSCESLKQEVKKKMAECIKIRQQKQQMKQSMVKESIMKDCVEEWRETVRIREATQVFKPRNGNTDRVEGETGKRTKTQEKEHFSQNAQSVVLKKQKRLKSLGRELGPWEGLQIMRDSGFVFN